MSEADLAFDMAQQLRRSHCDRQGESHECVGEMTIKRGQICLSCQLCGKGEHVPGWDSAIAGRLSVIFYAAGVSWDSLDLDAKVRAIARYKRPDEQI